MSKLVSILHETTVSGVILSRDGIIVEVSEGWKRSADENGFASPDFGLGQNYLKYCISTDSQSMAVLRGLKRVLDGKAGYFSALYPCHAPDKERWFIMAAFASDGEGAGIPILHIDVSHLFRGNESLGLAEMGEGDSRSFLEALRRIVAEAVTEKKAGPSPQDHEISASEQKKLNRLSPRQKQMLAYLAAGASNAEIALALEMTTNTVKAQVAAALRKLEFANRTQAALFAAKVGLNGSAFTSAAPGNKSERT